MGSKHEITLNNEENSAGMCGIVMLVLHMLLFSVVTVAGKITGVDYVNSFASLFPYDWIQHVVTYASWCAAILVQTLIEVLLMVMLVVRRQRWTKNLLAS